MIVACPKCGYPGGRDITHVCMTAGVSSHVPLTTETPSPAAYEERIRLLQNLYDELFAQTEQLRVDKQRARDALREEHDALGLAMDLLRQEDYARDPDYRQEWQTLVDADKLGAAALVKLGEKP